MGMIIDPSDDFIYGFREFVEAEYGEEAFSVAAAANEYFQYRYKTKDKWTDPKNITGWVKRRSENGFDFDFIGEKNSEKTGRPSKHYKIKPAKEIDQGLSAFLKDHLKCDVFKTAIHDSRCSSYYCDECNETYLFEY